MLFEAFLHATAKAHPAARNLGLVGDAVALWSRSTRRSRAWRPHELACREIVARAVAELTFRRTVLVLGSGLLRDVPVDLLARAFRRVVLVDGVHLLPARSKARRHGAELALADLSGLGAVFLGSAEERADPLASWRADPEIDLVISANLLSQLPFALDRWLERHPEHAKRLPDHRPNGVIAAHLADLAGFAGRVCLLTDTAYRVVRRDGILVEEVDLLQGVELPEPDACWNWEVAPVGEIARDEAHIHLARGYVDFRPG